MRMEWRLREVPRLAPGIVTSTCSEQHGERDRCTRRREEWRTSESNRIESREVEQARRIASDGARIGSPLVGQAHSDDVLLLHAYTHSPHCGETSARGKGEGALRRHIRSDPSESA